MKAYLSVLIFIILFSFAAIAQDKTVVRQNINKCNTFYVPYEAEKLIPFDTSMGFKLTNDHDVFKFQKKAHELLKQEGEEVFYKGRFIITGVNYGDKRISKKKYLDALDAIGIDISRVKIKIMRYAFDEISFKSKNIVKAIVDNLRYNIGFSVSNDFQEIYFKQKFLKSIVRTAIVESSGITFVLASTDFDINTKIALISTNVALFIVYDLFKDTMINWLTRPGSNKFFGLTKSGLLSVPFLASYAIMGEYTSVSEFISTNGLDVALEHMYNEKLGPAVAYMAPTALLGVLWHRFFNADGLFRWYKSKTEIKESLKAFTLIENLKVPTGIAFSMVYAMAANPHAQTALKLGVLGEYNSGQVSMLLMTAICVGALKIYPKLLDNLLKVQTKLGNMTRSAADKMKARFSRSRSTGQKTNP